MTKGTRLYWAWIHKGSRAIDHGTLTHTKKDLVRDYVDQNWPGRIVRVSVKVISQEGK